MTPEIPVQPPAPNNELIVTLTRLEAKVDVVLATHDAKLEAHSKDLSDHETRLRGLESQPTVGPDHEARLRMLESRPTVAPRTLWTVTVSALTLILGVVATLISIF